MNARKRTYWRLAVVAVVIVSIFSFTPLVLNRSSPEPYLFGMPHTLWASMAIAFVLVLLTFVGAYLHPESGDDEEAA